MAARSSSSSKARGKRDWKGLLTLRLVGAGLFALAACGLAAASFLREGMATKSPLARSRQEIALAALRPGQPEWAAGRARSLALRDPLQAASFVILGISRMSAGKLDAAARVAPLMQAAHARQPSLEQPQVWLAAYHARSGDPAAAVAEFDAALARSGGLVEQTVPILLLMLQEPRTRPAIIERIRAFPGWRTPALTAAIGKGLLPRGDIEALLAGPAPKGKQTMLDAERQAYLGWLVEQGDAPAAFDHFRRYAGIDPAAPVYDGRFAVKDPMRPFGWALADAAEDFAERVANPAGGWMVRAHASGKRNVVLLAQTLGLGAGSWNLRMQARDGGLARPERMTLTLQCAGQGDNRVLGIRSLASLGTKASETALAVTVPADCLLQRLAIEAAEGDESREAAEIEILSVTAGRP